VSVTFADNDERRVLTDNAGGLVSILNPVRTSQTLRVGGEMTRLSPAVSVASRNRGPSFSDGNAEIGTERALRLCIRTPHFRSKYSLNWSESAGYGTWA
jgi:hypothetical protein